MINYYKQILEIVQSNAGITDESIQKHYPNFKIGKFKKLVPMKKLKVLKCSQGHKHICFTEGIFIISSWSDHEKRIGRKMGRKFGREES